MPNTESARSRPTLVGRLRAGGDLAATLGARAASSSSSAARSSAASVTTCGRLADLLRVAGVHATGSPAAARPGPERTTRQSDARRARGDRPEPLRRTLPSLHRRRRSRVVRDPRGARCEHLRDAGTLRRRADDLRRAPSISTGEQIRFPPVTLHASPIAAGVAGAVPPAPGRTRTSSDFNMSVCCRSRPVCGGGHVRWRHRIRHRVNQPRPVSPPPGGCTCDQIDLTHVAIVPGHCALLR